MTEVGTSATSRGSKTGELLPEMGVPDVATSVVSCRRRRITFQLPLALILPLSRQSYGPAIPRAFAEVSLPSKQFSVGSLNESMGGMPKHYIAEGCEDRPVNCETLVHGVSRARFFPPGLLRTVIAHAASTFGTIGCLSQAPVCCRV